MIIKIGIQMNGRKTAVCELEVRFVELVDEKLLLSEGIAGEVIVEFGEIAVVAIDDSEGLPISVVLLCVCEVVVVITGVDVLDGTTGVGVVLDCEVSVVSLIAIETSERLSEPSFVT